MLRSLFVFHFILLQFTIQAQKTFEGTVSMSIFKGKDVTTRTIWVKNKQIRIEETIGDKKSIYLIDGAEKVGYILSEERNLYMKTSAWKQTKKRNLSEPVVTDVDSMIGNQVEKWELMDRDLKRVISFYFSPNNFYFYRDMLYYLPERDYLEQIFLELPLADDVMPIKATWKDINGQLIYQLKVTEIKQISLPEDLFAIPETYEQF